MPVIVGALLGQDPADLDSVAALARKIVGPKRRSALRVMADDTERNFGLLLGHQQHTFPGLPAPIWVWADPSEAS